MLNRDGYSLLRIQNRPAHAHSNLDAHNSAPYYMQQLPMCHPGLDTYLVGVFSLITKGEHLWRSTLHCTLRRSDAVLGTHSGYSDDFIFGSTTPHNNKHYNNRKAYGHSTLNHQPSSICCFSARRFSIIIFVCFLIPPELQRTDIGHNYIINEPIHSKL